MIDSTMYSEKHLPTPPTLFKVTDSGLERESGELYASRHPTRNYRNGGSSLVSTVRDYSIFADTLASGGISENGYRLIKPETIEKMKEHQFDALDIKSSFTCVQGTDYAYGLGVRVRTRALECGIPVGEFGWDGAAGSYVLMDTDNGISITMGMNILFWPNIFTGEHLNIAKLIYEEIL